MTAELDSLDSPKAGVQTLIRALDILEQVGSVPDGFTLTEISQRVHLNKTTVLRLLTTLVDRGYIRKAPLTQRYNVGLKALSLTSEFLSSIQFREVALPYLRRLQEATEETVNLAILDGGEVVYIDRRESPHVVRASFRIGKRAPVHCTALGKAILAFVEPEVARHLLMRARLVKLTPKTIVDLDILAKQFSETRQTGIAIDDEEHQPDMRCIGAPIFDITGRVIAAISVSGPLARITPDRLPALCSATKSTAESISRELGWQPGRIRESALADLG